MNSNILYKKTNYFLEKNINTYDVSGNTILHYAIINEDYNSIYSLIKKKDINLNIKNKNGHNIFHLLFFKLRKYIILNKIIKEHILLEIINDLFDTYYYNPIKYDNTFKNPLYILKNIVDKKDFEGNTIIIRLFFHSRINMIPFFIDRLKLFINFSYINKNGNNLLHLVCYKFCHKNNVELFDLFLFLLNFGCDKEQLNHENKTPLEILDKI